MEWTDDDELVGGDGRPRGPSRVGLFGVGRRSTDGDDVTRASGEAVFPWRSRYPHSTILIQVL